MYAVVKTGGKQYRVEEGSQIEVERLGEAGNDVELTPVLLVDGDTTLATPDQLSKAKVTATIVGDTRGVKIEAYSYKNKSNQRRNWGHRQSLSTIEIKKITKG